MSSQLNYGYLNATSAHNAQAIQSEKEEQSPYQLSRHEEAMRAYGSFTKAKDAINSNIIPREFNQSILNSQTNPLVYNQRPEQTDIDNSAPYMDSQLTGQPLLGGFRHNNMVPFFGAKVRQSTYEYANSRQLENFTGVENFAIEKTEQEPMFNPTPLLGNNYGTPDTIEEQLQYMVPAPQRNNELPFEQLRVGPGLNKGYTNLPSGGFQQADSLDYIRPKTVDELRVKTNPRISYHGRVVPGKFVVSKQTAKSSVQKNRPDSFYINSPDRYFTTTGAYLKEKKRPCIILKDTNRKQSKALYGAAAPAYVKNQMSRPKFQESDRQNFENDYVRNAFSKEKWDDQDFGDYGKQGYNPPPNERDITGSRFHITNLMRFVKAITAPLEDVMRTTTKETTEDNYRPYGNLENTAPEHGIVWDPNDIARTTIKETTVDNPNQSGYMGVSEKNRAWDPNDIARTTIKETTEDNPNQIGYMIVRERNRVWDTQDLARVTTRETTEDNPNQEGYVSVATYKGQVWDPNDLLRTTIKETTIDNPNQEGYVSVSTHNGPVWDCNDIARTTTKETTIEDGRFGVPSGENVSSRGKGYLTNPQTPFNTNRQTTQDYEYMGVAYSKDVKPMSYDADYNMRTNEVREGTLVGRYPTPESVKLWVGGDMINIDSKKMDGDRINSYQPGLSKVYQAIADTSVPCSLTAERNVYDEDKIGIDRINPALLDAFRSNPYTQSLESYAFP